MISGNCFLCNCVLVLKKIKGKNYDLGIKNTTYYKLHNKPIGRIRKKVKRVNKAFMNEGWNR